MVGVQATWSVYSLYHHVSAMHDPWGKQSPRHLGFAILSAGLIGVLLSFVLMRGLESHVGPLAKRHLAPAPEVSPDTPPQHHGWLPRVP